MQSRRRISPSLETPPWSSSGPGGGIATGESELAIECLYRLDEAIGGDPALDVMRARAYEDAGRIAEARTCASRAAEREPALDGAWWTLVDVALRQKDWKEVARGLEGAETNLGWKPGDHAAESGYEEFVKSDEYRAWLAQRGGSRSAIARV